MTSSPKVRLAVIGVGSMGSQHARDIALLESTDLAAVCDIDPQRLERITGEMHVPGYASHTDLLEQVELDGVLVATPHYDHTPISIAALEKGIHVLTEKPIAAHVQDAQSMIAAYEQARQRFPNLQFAIMFQQRTYGYWQKIKELVEAGTLGRLMRATWIITTWFRTQSYYDNGGWRATWKGEGGGVLLNQAPHNLDLYQWLLGMPTRLTGFASVGKYHKIEVEDEVTAVFEHTDGLVGHFITATAESPGTSRLEIVGELGRLVFEDDRITLFRNQYSAFTQIELAQGAFDRVPGEAAEVPFTHHGEAGHSRMIENFVAAIRQGEALVAPAPEGLGSLALANAVMLSSHLGRPVDLPLDAAAYAAWLQERITASSFRKNIREHDMPDLYKAFK